MTPPAQLHILLAQKGRQALVIRHGTAKSVCTLLWDRKDDTFALGQWMRGSIRKSMCDLSPDGEHFLYSASKSTMDGRIGWTVVSRTPYLKALAYYPRRYGGGWFLNKKEYCIPFGTPDPKDLEHPEVRRVDAEQPPSLYAARLAGNGWTIDDTKPKPSFLRSAGHGWTLRLQSTGRYQLTNGNQTVDTRKWDWADLDGKRLVYTIKGVLWAATVAPSGIEQPKLLHDFNGMKFEAIAAPYASGQPAKQLRPNVTPALAAKPAFARKRKPLPKKPNRSRVRPDDEA